MAPAPEHRRLLTGTRPRLPLGYRPSDAIFRAATAAAVGCVTGERAAPALSRLYPDDHGAATVLKAAASPGSTDADGWAAELTQQAVADFVGGLAPVSAAAALFGRAMPVPVERFGSTRFPAVSTGATAAWTAELDAIPVTSSVFSTGAELAPRKLAALAVLTREALRRSAAEAAVRALLSEAAAVALDVALFDDTAGNDTRPAGLLHGVAPITGHPGGDLVSITTDVSALVAAVAPIGGEIVLAMSAERAVRLSIMAPGLTIPILPSAHLGADRVVAVATRGLAFAPGEIQIRASSEAVIHMESEPEQIVPEGGEVSAPARSLWQTDAIALRMLADLAWCKRHPATAAVAEGVQW